MATPPGLTVAIIGGSGLYESGLFPREKTHRTSTPWGPPSGPVEEGQVGGVRTLFLARHGQGHVIPAHAVNYRANIDALVGLGADVILATNSVGSLKEDLPPGSFVVPSQFVDWTKGRPTSFFNGGRTYHISMADPFCPALERVAQVTSAEAKTTVATRKTYVCVEGPRFSTRAESHLFRSFADVIGMTLVPEATLAREREVCYLPLCMVTDFDVWADKPVDAHEIVEVMHRNVDRMRDWVRAMVPRVPPRRECRCHSALENAGL